MKTKLITLSITSILFAIIQSPVIFAQDVDKPNIKVKCFVDLYGGGQSIYTAYLSEELYKTLPFTLIDQKVYTASRDNKKNVYAVNECVLSKDRFKSGIANNLEKTMPK